ncbi:unnamed protein product [Prunus armeniaca]
MEMQEETDTEARKKNGKKGQNSVPNSEDCRTEEITEISGYFEYDGLNFQNMSIADLVGREFAKFEEAKRFYWNYALAIGFSIRKSRLRRSEGGVVMGRQWVCSKEGSRSKKWTNRDDMICTPRKETRENFHAAFAVKYCLKQDAYIVTFLHFHRCVTEHNHRLTNSHEVPFLHFHRRTYDYMVDQAGGYMKVRFTSKDLYNKMDFERRQVVLDGDAQAAISYMNAKDRKPVSIVTDGDEAMRVAIDEVFPDAHRLLCSWHIIRNVNSNVNNLKIVREFSYCVHGGLTPVAFEQHWQHMIDTYDLKGDWIEMMYRKRKRWAKAYCLRHFFGGNTTTQCVEGMHKNLKDGIGGGMKLVECIPQIERSLLKLKNENVKDDFDSNNSHPLILMHFRSLEEHAAFIFTHDIYKLIRNEINKEAKLILMQPVTNNEDPRVYKIFKFGTPDEK